MAIWVSNHNLNGTTGTDRDIFYSYSSDKGATWSNAAALNSGADTDGGTADYFPSVAMDSSGNVIVVWNRDEMPGRSGFDLDIMVSISSDAGQSWSPISALQDNADTDSGNDNIPDVAMDENGNAIAVWQSGEDLGTTAGTDRDIFVAYTNDYGASWSSPQLLNSDAANDSDQEHYPVVTSDNKGGWIALWLGDDVTKAYSAVSADNGASWSTRSEVGDGSYFESATLIVH